MAKAAIRAGVDILVKKAGITFDEVDDCYLAGGFGTKIDIKKAAGIGLILGYGSGVVDLSLLNIGTNKNNRFIGSLSNDRDEEYRLAGYVEELDRFLNKVSNGNVTVDDL